MVGSGGRPEAGLGVTAPRQLKISPRAVEDLRGLRLHVRDMLCDLGAADRIVDALFDAMERLCAFPAGGAPFCSALPVLAPYRRLAVERYQVVYRFDETTVFVVRVLHELQDQLAILLSEVPE